jgi:hypothetical protein
MKPNKNMNAIIDRKRYDVATALLLAGDDYWDGNNFERHCRNSFLYRTPKGSYFMVNLSQWQDEDDSLIPCTEGDAIRFFEQCREDRQRVYFEEAFPTVKVEEA